MGTVVGREECAALTGWSNSHLHMFRGEGFQVHMPSHKKAVYEVDTHYSDDKVTLQTVFTRQGNKKLLYIYDFGQNWRLTVEVKKAYYAEPGNLMRCSGGKCAVRFLVRSLKFDQHECLLILGVAPPIRNG